MERKRMPMEFLHGRPLSPGDPEMIRRQVEEFEVVAAVDHKIRGIVAAQLASPTIEAPARGRSTWARKPSELLPNTHIEERYSA
jgi:hypothetical protein